MDPTCLYKVFKGDRLPDLDTPFVIATLEIEGTHFFFSEYFVIRAGSKEVLSYRLVCNEHAQEFLTRYSPEAILEDTIESARAEVEAKAIEMLPTEVRYDWIKRGIYGLQELAEDKLVYLWARGRLVDQFYEVRNITRCRTLRTFLDKLVHIPRLIFDSERPATRPRD